MSEFCEYCGYAKKICLVEDGLYEEAELKND